MDVTHGCRGRDAHSAQHVAVLPVSGASPPAVRPHAQLDETLARARALGWIPRPTDEKGSEDSPLSDATLHLRELLGAELARPAPPRLAQLCATVLALSDLDAELRTDRVLRRLASTAQVRRAIGRLHALDDVVELIARAPVLLHEECGFDRAMVTRIRGSVIVLHSVHIPSDPELARRALEYGERTRPRLDHLLIETEMVRRRGPILVADVRSEPRVHREFTQLVDATGYVAAPIISAGRAIGFLHADFRDRGKIPDEVDREHIWAFAEAFGYLLERASLLERLRTQRAQIRGLLQSADVLLRSYADADVIFSGAEGDTASSVLAHLPPPLPASPAVDLDGLLTRREQEVLKLMVEGAQNRQVADQLVISPGTVKSHVARILRKLGAANRSEAVARYLSGRCDDLNGAAGSVTDARVHPNRR